MASKIFINYRRDDERAQAARIRDQLARVLGSRNVFMDVDDLVAGQRFDKELEQALAQFDVFVAVIGSRWFELLKIRVDSGDQDDVRQEIAAALKRGILVIPAVIEGASLPRPDQLPEDIRELVLHQRLAITHERFGRDVEELITAIKTSRRGRRTTSFLPGRQSLIALGLVVAVFGVGMIAYVSGVVSLPQNLVAWLEHRKLEAEAAQGWESLKGSTNITALGSFATRYKDTAFAS